MIMFILYVIVGLIVINIAGAVLTSVFNLIANVADSIHKGNK